MKNILLVMLATCMLCNQGCARKAYPSTQGATSSTQLLQGTWRLKMTEGTDTPTAGTPKPIITRFTPGEIVDVWTTTTVEEYLSGQAQGAVTYTIAGNTITTKTAQGEARTGQILTLTKDKLRLSWAQNTTLAGSPGTSTVICDYVK
jgi:hypothetical protein